jgi:hypothetical protein
MYVKYTPHLPSRKIKEPYYRLKVNKELYPAYFLDSFKTSFTQLRLLHLGHFIYLIPIN